MALREPESMDECVYFTNRATEKCKVRAWVFREQCPKCGKGLMGKPKDSKTGRAKIRAEEYECPECKCNSSDEISAPFQWKKIQRLNEETGKKQSIDSIRVLCSKCNEKIDVTKKMR